MRQSEPNNDQSYGNNSVRVSEQQQRREFPTKKQIDDMTRQPGPEVGKDPFRDKAGGWVN